ncbi:MAG: hypothetical protein EHM32_00375 [Spirochaetales bacterium]|nr:MAG: hypothetical protein EHM32_00375 [Spirochaetales bacterium]
MKKTFVVSAIILCASVIPALSYAGIEGDAYRTSYICNDLKGNRRWTATVEIRHKEGDIYNITEKMSGFYTGFDGKISWVATTDFERAKDEVRPFNMDQRICDDSGKPIAISKQEFDYKNNTVTCTYEDLVKNTVSEKRFKFSGNIINRMLQGLCGQKFIEAGQTSKNIQVISPEPALYNIQLKMVGEEDVEIGGRMRKAYKLCFDPMLGVLNFVKIFLPKSFVWHSSEPVFEWLKYRGLESSVSSPRVEIISLEKGVTTSIPAPQGPAS